jgi:transcriptional regulator with XRE-family HTH domain
MNGIAANIEAFRKKVGMKQEVLARQLGVTQGTYSGYLTQNKDIKYGLILDIANILNVSIVDIITYPIEYIPKEDECKECIEKDKIIKNLNEYIVLLKEKNKQLIK